MPADPGAVQDVGPQLKQLGQSIQQALSQLHNGAFMEAPRQPLALSAMLLTFANQQPLSACQHPVVQVRPGNRVHAQAALVDLHLGCAVSCGGCCC